MYLLRGAGRISSRTQEADPGCRDVASGGGTGTGGKGMVPPEQWFEGRPSEGKHSRWEEAEGAGGSAGGGQRRRGEAGGSGKRGRGSQQHEAPEEGFLI